MFLSRYFLILGSLLTLSLGATFTNPLKNPNGSDPFIVWDGNYYYLLTTTWNNVQMTRARTINGLKTGETKVIYSDSTSSRCCNVWAPEVHYFGDRWYIYYTAGNNKDLNGQRVHALRGGATPWDAYTYVRQVTPDWGIDASTLRLPQGNYLVWSCFSPAGLQSLCAAMLNNDFVSIGASRVISEPTLAWERVRNPVNEGPAALYHSNKTFIAYSASDCWSSSYQLGLLTWNGGDPLQKSSWSKSGPHFSSANGNYGTGHNGFFVSPDETQIWNVYHATADRNGQCGGQRYTMVKQVNWNNDGTPNFGVAERLGTTLQGPSGE
ncbi:glycoside hydrolase family 43 protein [Patellaria atrata CBS 101060]|uniref:Glycoside hydrolase family 43 protein n=1 Tax=Patellaria atrata CBS 101060 TaxID=1346257 RepID=A0A9P4SIP6_9PEZI|nr:glycoside hydrolase family 43 protein [Patellaria atrata CBS 101060]